MSRAQRVAIACQGGGSHTAFTAGVLQGFLQHQSDEVDIVALSGTSGGALCATLAWEGLVRGDRSAAIEKLRDFWQSIAATGVWDALVNQGMMHWLALRDQMAVPEFSPYQFPPWGNEAFKDIIERHFSFQELRQLAKKPGAPALHIGAVEVLTGHFETFTGPELSAECLMASAAIPELFRAITVPGRGVYWDGLFSQNPPIEELIEQNINELWLIQINPSTCTRVPTEVHEIVDRRNQLAGNLSMEQELKAIETMNRLIAEGSLQNGKHHPIHVGRIPLDRELEYRSKLDRRPEFLEELRLYGNAKARWFLKDRQAKKYTLRALGVLAEDGV